MDAIQEELTDRVFGDLVLGGKLVKQADKLYFGGETQMFSRKFFVAASCQI